MKVAVSLVASHSGCRSEVTKVPMDLQVMLESGPVERLLGEKATERRETASASGHLHLMTSSGPSDEIKPLYGDVSTSSAQYDRKQTLMWSFFLFILIMLNNNAHYI